jgi:hypothetical protein
MQPDFALATWAAKACAELVLDGPALIAARRHLLDRACALGHELTEDAGFRMLADGRPVPAEIDGKRWRVRLPEATASVRLLSLACIPAHTRPGDTDTRALGIAVAGLTLDASAVSLDDPRLAAGWHRPEPHWRWTTGDALLSVGGARELSFDVAITGTYWRAQAPAATPAARKNPSGSRRCRR